MNDLISRQAAIDALDCINGTEEVLRSLQSAQPLVIHCTDCEDWLERQSILGFTISELPAVQPQPVVRCKDCRYQDKGRNESESWNLCGYRPWLHVPTEDEHYCGYGERRTDERAD